MAATLFGFDVYLRHTDKEGNTFVQEHRAWDTERFINSQRDAARKVGGDVEQITRDQYLKERKK